MTMRIDSIMRRYRRYKYTRKREVDGLCKLAQRHKIDKMLIITKNESDTIEADGYTIEVVPVWKWLLE